MEGHIELWWGRRRLARAACLAAALLAAAGCAPLLRPVARRAAARTADSVVAAFFRQPDPATAEQGAPAFLLLLDGMILDNPGDSGLAAGGARAYAAYASAFVEDTDRERAHRLYRRAADYAGRAAPGWGAQTVVELEQSLEQADPAATPALFWLAMAWAGLARTAPAGSSGAALVDLTRAVRVMEWIARAAPETQDHGADLFLGAYYSLLPAGAGRDLARSRAHFERARMDDGVLAPMGRVLYARTYLRATFEREAFEAELAAVLAEPARPDDPQALLSALARRDAAALLEKSDEYFD